jgi:hypothetical protein
MWAGVTFSPRASLANECSSGMPNEPNASQPGYN